MKKGIIFCFIIPILMILFCLSAAAENEDSTIQIAVSYCAVECDRRPIMAEYSDSWLLAPPEEYNHKLMQASFAMAASAFRDNTHDLDQKDFNILNFFSRAGFTNPRTDDYDRITSIETIGSAIASKTVGDTTLIAVSMSGNNYQNEWLSNFTVSDLQRAEGFNDAAGRVLERIREYIREYSLSGKLRLWITGYSRAAAVANIAAADASDSGLFEAVFGYTIGTPRTTRDPDADRYDSIFNVINPFDPIPLMPFPEWGYRRYGRDMYLPAMETDSDYFIKKYQADSVSLEVTGVPVRFNPQVNRELHTILDFLLFYIRSSNSYKETFQSGILELWEKREYKPLLENIGEHIEQLGDITVYEVREFYYFLDYLCQVLYTSFRGQKFHPSDLYWNPGLSLQENLMHEHYDSAYLAWIFSSDDPDWAYKGVPHYAHYTILGDVDVELFDSTGDFIERIDHSGKISTDPADVKATGFTGGKSPVMLFAERNGKQTFIILPMDQSFSAVIHSREDQEVRYSYVDYAADAIQGDVRYVYSENLKKDSSCEGLIDRYVVEGLSDEDLAERGFFVIEPWTKDTVYSPSAIMRLENADVFHPSPASLLTLGGLILLFASYILVLTTVGTGKAVVKGVRKIRARAHKAAPGKKANNSVPDDRKKALSDANHAKIEKTNLQKNESLKDEDHENQ